MNAWRSPMTPATTAENGAELDETGAQHLERVAPWRLDAVPGQNTPRFLLTCCVRLSREKEPERFVSLCAELVRRGVVLGGTNEPGTTEIVPVLCASTAGDYAETIRAKFLDATRGKGWCAATFSTRAGWRVCTDGRY